ncbi:hypothetical protein MIMGU_mgv1a024697mg [Erythranthe guttata]|uniref:KIB1-4 beta-propeller domain-containing protein n=1 Tax=Erythranthe guttata TaxID=4155 RepID=A0A022RPB1_ERYGU|nr:hypothetical protein MIMGU_mgv1a024697mg [Erythranthe guttata]
MPSCSAGSPSLLFLPPSPNLFGGYGYGSRLRLIYRNRDAQFSIRINRKIDFRSSHGMNISPKSSPNIFAGGCVGIRTASISDESVPRLPPTTSPWLMLPPFFGEGGGGGGGDMVYNFYSLAENEVLSFAGDGKSELPLPYENAEFVGCSHGWIALFDNSNSDLFLFNPISGRHLKLPPINNYGCVTNTGWPSAGLAGAWTGLPSENIPPPPPKSEDEFDAWDLRDHRYPRRIPMDDVAVDYGQTFLASMDNHEAEIGYLRFLVVSDHSDELFLVRRFVMERVNSDDDSDDVPYKTIGFDVHRYCSKGRLFKYMDKGSLDGLAFFIGINHGFALCADDYIGLKPNSIYFTDTYSPPDRCGNTYGGHDIGIFSYEDGTVSPCYYPCDVGSIQRISPSPMWFTPNVPI